VSKPGVTGIYIGSGVSARTEDGFCQVTVQLTDGRVFEGQLTPEEVRSMARDWFEAAEGAVHDAAVFKKLTRDLGLEAEGAAVFIGELREHRQDADSMVPPPEGP
jgi:hypothetical protein